MKAHSNHFREIPISSAPILKVPRKTMLLKWTTPRKSKAISSSAPLPRAFPCVRGLDTAHSPSWQKPPGRPCERQARKGGGTPLLRAHQRIHGCDRETKRKPSFLGGSPTLRQPQIGRIGIHLKVMQRVSTSGYVSCPVHPRPYWMIKWSISFKSPILRVIGVNRGPRLHFWITPR